MGDSEIAALEVRLRSIDAKLDRIEIRMESFWYWDFIAGSTGIAILSWIFRTISAWLAARKAARWYEAANCVLVAVGSVAQTLVDALKKSRADGKLTDLSGNQACGTLAKAAASGDRRYFASMIAPAMRVYEAAAAQLLAGWRKRRSGITLKLVKRY
jgi:hypothetical protein